MSNNGEHGPIEGVPTLSLREQGGAPGKGMKSRRLVLLLIGVLAGLIVAHLLLRPGLARLSSMVGYELARARSPHALKFLRLSTVLNPRDARAWSTLCAQGTLLPVDDKTAEQWCAEAANRNSNSVSYLFKAEKLEASGETELAREAYRKAVSLTPRGCEENIAYSRFERKAGNQRLGIELLSKYASIDKPCPISCEILAGWLFEAEEFESAVRPLECAVARGPSGHRQFHLLQLGYIYERTGDDAKAQEMYRQARPVPDGARYSCVARGSTAFDLKACGVRE